ncbi:MAG: hypothetical protein HY735_25875 [Verrucomicrobia bacterium]|nr:hypothetical protein [Verrucomicrobiota bacterium]
MMRIPFQQPQIDPSQTAKCKKLVQDMGQLVQELTRWGQQPGNTFKMLTPANRAELVNGGFEKRLVANLAFFTERIRVQEGDGFVEKDALMIGFTADAFDSKLYASDPVKRALIQSHQGRCAYCESLIHHTAYGDVEHFRPKAGYTVPPSPVVFRPGYFALAYEPGNLFYSCQLCNEAAKGNDFPVIGERYPKVTVDSELPVLVNPYTEDPRNFIRFNPLNARAYPYDLVQAFYTATRGWGTTQTEATLWLDPAKIPGQTNAQGASISDPGVDEEFQSWMPTVGHNPFLQRGQRTISMLELNRPALIRARASQLLKLRGLVGLSSAAGPDQLAAQQLIQTLLGGNPAGALLAPEYISASIDALQTWNVRGAGNVSWTDLYSKILSAFVPEADLVEPPPYNDALMHIVLASEAGRAGQRRIVYLSDNDKVYGNASGEPGVFLAIDWEKELENTVLLMRAGQVVRKTTLRQLIGGDAGQLWRTFATCDVWAIGDYQPLASG